MPSKTKQKNAEIAERSAALPRIPEELMDQLVQRPHGWRGGQRRYAVLQEGADRARDGRQAGHHLGQGGAEAGNHRNGTREIGN